MHSRRPLRYRSRTSQANSHVLSAPLRRLSRHRVSIALPPDSVAAGESLWTESAPVGNVGKKDAKRVRMDGTAGALLGVRTSSHAGATAVAITLPDHERARLIRQTPSGPPNLVARNLPGTRYRNRRRTGQVTLDAFDTDPDTLLATVESKRAATMGSLAEALISRGRAEGETKGRADGEARGRAKGEVRGRASTLNRLLEHKFGRVPSPVRKRVRSAPVHELDAWLDAVLDAPTLEAYSRTRPGTDRGPALPEGGSVSADPESGRRLPASEHHGLGFRQARSGPNHPSKQRDRSRR